MSLQGIKCVYCPSPARFPYTRCIECINNKVNDSYLEFLMKERLEKK